MARDRAAQNLTPAVAYFRTSSAANVGPDKDSLARQRAAVAAYAKAHRLEIVREFRDDLTPAAAPAAARARSWSRPPAASPATSWSSSPATTC